jgi:putative transposase
MRYIDLNMVRTGRVSHPSQWDNCGYHRIQVPLQRENRIDLEQVMQCLGFDNLEALQSWQRSAIQDALQLPLEREPQWTQAIAIGDSKFLGAFAKSLNLPTHKHTIENGVLNDPSKNYVLRKLLGQYYTK